MKNKIAGLLNKLSAAEKALSKINDIRNSIIGTQTINWSEHIYPLVAALNEAGLQGLHYPEARKYYGTMLERTKRAEQQRDDAKQRVTMMRGILQEYCKTCEEIYSRFGLDKPYMCEHNKCKIFAALQATSGKLQPLVKTLETEIIQGSGKKCKGIFGELEELAKWKGVGQGE